MIRARDVYDVLGLPVGLRMHLARTVAVVRLLVPDETNTLNLSREAELAMALHDVGNAVKFADEPAAALTMLQEPPETLERWRLYSAYTRARYGEDDHVATAAMLTELGVRESLIELIARKSSRNLRDILDQGSPTEIVTLYADMRVAPHGVVSIEERHREATARLVGTERQGLGGTLTLGDLEELESRVCGDLGSDPAAVTPPRVEDMVGDCIDMEVSDAFA